MYRKIVVLFSSFLLSTFYYLLSTNYVFAQDFRNDYQVEYFLSENQNKLNAKVKFTIAITNHRPDLYVKQFSIGFPKSFTIRNITAADDHNNLTPKITSDDLFSKIQLEFSNPNVGRNSVNNFFLQFDQDNLFTINGNVWEVIIPTVENKKDSAYKIIVYLPESSDKKISISKPKPDSISGNTIVWNNPYSRTVYAIFGDIQYYKSQLTYHLKNSQLLPVYTDIAFPPDTLWQKIYLNKIDPNPDKTFSDEEGNFFGRYFLKPQETKTVNYLGTIAIFAKARDEILPYIRTSFSSQKKYLLSESKYWKISNPDIIKQVSANPKEIFYFVTNKLQYDYNKVNSDNKRLGAAAVLNTPERAVCMEFTDLFIALAREKGIYAREIEGYGFSQDPKIRPLSLVSDILHSWPEYYDEKSGYWIQVDPTWEDTSGIDYFSSFDLNHITFAIHGRKPDYPLPAGTYKFEDSRDVEISASQKIPAETKKLSFEYDKLPSQINDSQLYQTKLTLKNDGNTYFWGSSIPIIATNLAVKPKSLDIAPLAPFEKKQLIITYKASEKNKRSKGNFTLAIPSGETLKFEFSIIPFYYDLAVKLSLGILVLISILSIILKIKHRRVNTTSLSKIND